VAVPFGKMNVPAIVTVSATMPFFAAVIGDKTPSNKEDLLAVAYFAAVGPLISFAAILDDVYDLTPWFGLMPASGVSIL
jgi:hypothetical protein